MLIAGLTVQWKWPN